MLSCSHVTTFLHISRDIFKWPIANQDVDLMAELIAESLLITGIGAEGVG